MRLLIICCWLIIIHGVASAQSSKTLAVKGLQQAVEVTRDNWGVNHIYAKNQHDLFFAQGYCAAEDRLFQFELWRRQVTGTMAEITGSRDLQRDLAMRLFKFRGNMKEEMQQYHRDGLQIIQAFVEGINAYINQVNNHSEELPIEFNMLGIQPQLWTPDIVISRHQGVLVNVLEELNIGRSVAVAGDSVVKKLQWFHPGNPDIQLDTAIDGNALQKDILALYNWFRSDLSFTRQDIVEKYRAVNGQTTAVMNSSFVSKTLAEEEGSNNWAIAPGRSASGYAMLASDPHRKITMPSLRYIVHLNAPGWNVMGAGEPYTPGVAIGHNDYGAWGITVHQTDIEDVYVYRLNPLNLSQYWYNGGWVQMEEVKEKFRIKSAEDTTVILRYTKHGPVTFIDSAKHIAYAVRAAWLLPGNAPYLASLRMDQATSWSEFQQACMYSFLPSLNMVWADKKGTIGWQVTGRIPVRKNFSGLVPVPGDGRYEWDGFLPIKERPHLLNPAKGYIATANENLIPAGFQHSNATGFSWPDAYRANRVNELLTADSAMSLKLMKKYQTDYLSIPAKLLVPMLEKLSINDTLVNQAKEQMLSWNYSMAANEIGAGIFNKWEREMMTEAREQFFPAPLNSWLALQTTRLIEWLKNPRLIFDNDAPAQRDAFLVKTFSAAVAKLRQQLGTNVKRWQFGQAAYKHSQFIHLLNGLVDSSWQPSFNTVSMPRGGYGHTVGATGNQDNQGNGASFRYLVDTKDWDATLMINTPGQSGNPASPWYKNLFQTWARDEYFPAYFSKNKIEAVAAEKKRLMPAR